LGSKAHEGSTGKIHVVYELYVEVIRGTKRSLVMTYKHNEKKG